MQKHSHNTKRKQNRKSHAPRQQTHRSEANGFLGAFEELVTPKQWAFIGQALGRRRGVKARLAWPKFLMSLVYHFFSGAGYFSEHVRQLFGLDYSDSAASERRQACPWEVFARFMQVALRPLAQKKKHPEAFYRQWRLLALDGVQFSLNNSPAVKREASKAKSRRGRAAFAKMPTAVLLELGAHNPLAAAIGRKGESEWRLAMRLLAQLPGQCLLLADQLFGRAAFIAPLLDRCRAVQSEFLIRVEKRLKSRVVKRLKDGSHLVEVDLRDKADSHQIVRTLKLREIRASLQRRGFRTQQLRLWTSLLDCHQAPAMELAKLYGQRWEQELYFRCLKYELRRSERLQSQTVETAAQEIAAWIISSALIARQRARAANGIVPILKVSFIKLVELLRPLWMVLSLGSDLLSKKQEQQLTERFLEEAQRCLTPKRRTRSCPRQVRQPVTGWPRLRRNRYWNDPVKISI